ncbi:unnamed protein product, partial [Closterium sp. NIES-53]
MYASWGVTRNTCSTTCYPSPPFPLIPPTPFAHSIPSSPITLPPSSPPSPSHCPLTALHRPDDDFPASPTSAALLAATPRSASDPIESFAFALVNGSLGVFELRGKRVRDFR